VIRYTTLEKQSITKATELGSNPRQYAVGEKLTVFYDPENAESFTLSDYPTVSVERIVFGLGVVALLYAAISFVFSV
jgi:hypothetical protein